jgi:hypothetical protein
VRAHKQAAVLNGQVSAAEYLSSAETGEREMNDDDDAPAPGTPGLAWIDAHRHRPAALVPVRLRGAMQRHTACLFAALIAKLDDRGSADEGLPAGLGTAGETRDRVHAMPHKVLKDIGVGYLATCYLASTILNSGPSKREANQ